MFEPFCDTAWHGTQCHTKAHLVFRNGALASDEYITLDLVCCKETPCLFMVIL